MISAVCHLCCSVDKAAMLDDSWRPGYTRLFHLNLLSDRKADPLYCQELIDSR
ncbi:MAG: hypothetical protein BWY27_01131 [Bacteroidetes bacterium ADurb.Bin234]|nr:MAG: hypothetical protein BWY27_01131 [Bacteroidetes bacterium ADurb.Bin234]